MRKKLLLLLGIALIVLPLSVGAFTPMNYPDLESAFKLPDSGKMVSPSGLNNPDSLKVPAWKSWQSPSTNNYAESLKVPTSWNSPTTTNYTSFLKVPAWKSWVSPSTTNYTSSFTIPDVRSRNYAGTQWGSQFPVFSY